MSSLSVSTRMHTAVDEFINPINSKTKLEMELLLHKQNLILAPIGNIFMNLTPLPLPNPQKKGER
jgi:hypothetical protein